MLISDYYMKSVAIMEFSKPNLLSTEQIHWILQWPLNPLPNYRESYFRTLYIFSKVDKDSHGIWINKVTLKIKSMSITKLNHKINFFHYLITLTFHNYFSLKVKHTSFRL